MDSGNDAQNQMIFAERKSVYVREEEKFAFDTFCRILGCPDPRSEDLDKDMEDQIYSAIKSILDIHPKVVKITKVSAKSNGTDKGDYTDSDQDTQDGDEEDEHDDEVSTTEDDKGVVISNKADYSNESYRYSFIFVGVIDFRSMLPVEKDGKPVTEAINQIILCYPKYLMKDVPFEEVNYELPRGYEAGQDADPELARRAEQGYKCRKTARDELKQILKVLRVYNGREQTVKILSDIDISDIPEDIDNNILEVMLFLLDDYYENGVYSSSETVTEINGMGEIEWSQTINGKLPVISKGAPYYMEMYTLKIVDDEYDFFTRLHKAVLTEISRRMSYDPENGDYDAYEDRQTRDDSGEIDFLSLLDYPEIYLTDETLEDFGVTEEDNEYVLTCIDKELGVQFNSRKQLILKALYVYISHRRYRSEIENITIYGTSTFNLVWEKVCSAVFNNMRDWTLEELYAVLNRKLPVSLEDKKDSSLKGMIECPAWTLFGKTYYRNGTLIPDTVSVSGSRFIIYDAKYYVPDLSSGSLSGQPGIGSVTKQMLYELAYKDLIEDLSTAHGDGYKVLNCFLFPTDQEISKGSVRFGMLQSFGLSEIQVIFLPAMMMYELYVSGGTYPDDIFETSTPA